MKSHFVPHNSRRLKIMLMLLRDVYEAIYVSQIRAMTFTENSQGLNLHEKILILLSLSFIYSRHFPTLFTFRVYSWDRRIFRLNPNAGWSDWRFILKAINNRNPMSRETQIIFIPRRMDYENKSEWTTYNGFDFNRKHSVSAINVKSEAIENGKNDF